MSVKMKVVTLAILSILFSVSLVTILAVNSFDAALTKSSKEKLESTIDDKGQIIKILFESYSSLLLSLTNSQLAKESLLELSDSFYKIEKEISADIIKLEEELIFEYDSHYLNSVNYDVEGSQRRLTSQYLPSKDSGKIAQKMFIMDNSNPHGEKNKLEFDAKYESISYMKMHEKYHSSFNKIVEDFKLMDIFVVNLNGDIVYSAFKEFEFGTSLRKDIYKLSPLGRVFFKTLKAEEKTFIFEDFAPYEPSKNLPAGFLGSPIFIDGKVEGAIIFQVPLNKVNNILSGDFHGKTDETFLVGQDFKLKTELRFIDKITDNPFVSKYKQTTGYYEINNDFITDALVGNSGFGTYNNYTGEETIIGYAPLNIFGTTWAIASEVSTDEGTEDATQIIKEVFTASLLATLLSVVIIFILIDKFMGAPLNRIIDTTKNISSGDGDLTKRLPITVYDEFGHVSENINSFVERMQTLVNDVKDLADRNIDVSKQLEKISTAISERIKIENKTLSDISENGKTISYNIKETTSNIKETKGMISDSNIILVEAKQEIHQLANKVSIASVNQKNLAKKLSNLSLNSEKIKDVLYVIDDIADQTNLLALNAAIEAARAGEFGKGFAVVAYEVTKLADKTQSSLSDVNKIVAVVLDEMKEAVILMNKSASGISELSVISSDASRKITATSTTIEESVDIIERTVISAVIASEKTTEIIDKIQQITRLSNDNMSSTVDMAETSEVLSKSGFELEEKLSHYKS